MATLSFDDLYFVKNKDLVKVIFLNFFYFYLKADDLKKIAEFRVDKNIIAFKNISEKSASNKFNMILSKGFNNLRSSISGKKTTYIHRRSGVPLIGNACFGLIDRNTNIIEVKPITGCNLNCIYCSVDEGKSSKKQADFVVEKDYIVQEFRRLAVFKGKSIEAHIGTHGEPLLYKPLVELVHDISQIPHVKTISIDTNGILLNEKIIDNLLKAGLTRINLSINSLNPDLAKKIAGCNYSVNHIKRMAKIIAGKNLDLIIAPVWIPGINDKEIPKLIAFAKKLMPRDNYPIGIQNFLNYKRGRNPVRAQSFALFYSKLKEWEKEFDISLRADSKESFYKIFKVQKTKNLPKPFKKGQLINVEIICPGKWPGELIGVNGRRSITLTGHCAKKKAKVKITRTKHNIFYAA